MKYEEKGKMLHILRGVDILTSESKGPATIVDLVDLIGELPAPTVYSHVDRACTHGLLTKGKMGKRKAVSITLSGYRLLEKDAPIEAMQETKAPLLTTEQAFRIVCELYVSSESNLSSQRREVVESLINLIEEK